MRGEIEKASFVARRNQGQFTRTIIFSLISRVQMYTLSGVRVSPVESELRRAISELSQNSSADSSLRLRRDFRGYRG